MSALSSEADVTLVNYDVRFTPESGHIRPRDQDVCFGPDSDFGQCPRHVRFSSDSDQIADITPRQRKLAIREFAIGRLGLGVRFNLGATEGCDVFATINKKRFRRL